MFNASCLPNVYVGRLVLMSVSRLHAVISTWDLTWIRIFVELPAGVHVTRIQLAPRRGLILFYWDLVPNERNCVFTYSYAGFSLYLEMFLVSNVLLPVARAWFGVLKNTSGNGGKIRVLRVTLSIKPFVAFYKEVRNGIVLFYSDTAPRTSDTIQPLRSSWGSVVVTLVSW